MTDKVQIIREEVERLQNELIQEKEKGYGSDVDDACILELQNVLTYIDSMQLEEIPPKLPLISQKKCMYTKDDFTDEDRKVLCDGCKEECKYAQKEEPVSEDLELTWEDVRRIYLIVNSTINDVGIYNLTDKSIYQEVLRRFKALKRENNYYGQMVFKKRYIS